MEAPATGAGATWIEEGERPTAPPAYPDDNAVTLVEEVDLDVFVPGVEDLPERIRNSRDEMTREMVGQPLRMAEFRRLGYRTSIKGVLKRASQAMGNCSRSRRAAEEVLRMAAQVCRFLFLETVLTAVFRPRSTNPAEDATQRMAFYQAHLEAILELQTMLTSSGLTYPRLFSEETPLHATAEEEEYEGLEALSLNTNNGVRYEGVNEPLPAFSGELREWDSFWEQFVALVDRSTRLTPILKLKKLISALKGDAREQARGFRFVAASYEPLKAHLQNVYGSPERILQHIFQRLLAAPRVSRDCGYQEFSKLALLAQEFIRDSLHFHPDRVNDPELIIAHIRRKLPEPVMVRWEDQSLALPIKEKLRAFDQFLTREMALKRIAHLDSQEDREARGSGASNAKGEGGRKPTTYSFATDATESSKKGCPFCGEDHSAPHCSKEITPTEKKKRLLRARCCLLCMEPGHPYRSCKKPACGECGEDHHTALHGADYVSLRRRRTQPQKKTTA